MNVVPAVRAQILNRLRGIERGTIVAPLKGSIVMVPCFSRFKSASLIGDRLIPNCLAKSVSLGRSPGLSTPSRIKSWIHSGPRQQASSRQARSLLLEGSPTLEC